MAKVIQDYPEVGAILDAYQKGEYHNLTLSQEALQALADATGVNTEVLLTNITAQQGIQGATNKELTVIDTHDELRQDSIQTLAHELDHVRGGKNETLADLAGLAAKLNTEAVISANKDTINSIKAQMGDGTDTLTTAQNQALLNQNNQTFTENHEGKEREWRYDHDRLLSNGSYGHPGDRVTFTDQEALIIKQVVGNVLTPVDVMEAYYSADTDAKRIEALAQLVPVAKARVLVQRIGSRVLQTGGNTLNSNTIKSLNNYFGSNYTKREIGRALEELKQSQGLPNNHHGKIHANGDYTDSKGNVIGNIGDYL